MSSVQQSFQGVIDDYERKSITDLQSSLNKSFDSVASQVFSEKSLFSARQKLDSNNTSGISDPPMDEAAGQRDQETS